MANIAKQLAALLGFTAVLYAILVAVGFALMPLPDTRASGLDSPAAPASVFMTQPKYVFLNRGALAADEDRDSVILVGSSNVARGFARPELQALIPAARVHSLSVSGANVTELGQVVDLVQEMRGPSARRRSVFVIGLWYGLFSEDRVRWTSADRTAGDTDIDIERYRYGFFRRSSSGPVAVLPPRMLDVGVAAIYPLLVADGIVRRLRDWTRDRLYERLHLEFLRRPRLGDEQEDDHIIDAREQQDWLSYRIKFMATPDRVADEQFAALERLVGTIVSSGSRVVIVDLPIPRWHAQASPHFADYQARKGEVLDRLRNQPVVTYLNMQDADGDFDYYDDTHPKRAATRVWCARLAEFLNPLIGGPVGIAAGATGRRAQD